MIYLKLNEKTKQAKLMLKFLQTLDFISVVEQPEETISLEEALKIIPFDKLMESPEFLKGLKEKPEDELNLLEQMALSVLEVEKMKAEGVPQQTLSEVLHEIQEEQAHE